MGRRVVLVVGRRVVLVVGRRVVPVVGRRVVLVGRWVVLVVRRRVGVVSRVGIRLWVMESVSDYRLDDIQILKFLQFSLHLFSKMEWNASVLLSNRLYLWIHMQFDFRAFDVS